MEATYLFLDAQNGRSLRRQQVFRDRIYILAMHDDHSFIE